MVTSSSPPLMLPTCENCRFVSMLASVSYAEEKSLIIYLTYATLYLAVTSKHTINIGFVCKCTELSKAKSQLIYSTQWFLPDQNAHKILFTQGQKLTFSWNHSQLEAHNFGTIFRITSNRQHAHMSSKTY